MTEKGEMCFVCVCEDGNADKVRTYLGRECIFLVLITSKGCLKVKVCVCVV